MSVSYPPTDLSDIKTDIAGKANLNQVPIPSTMNPPSVADNSGMGSMNNMFAKADHTHASKVRKQIITMPSAARTYTWVYPVPFATGVIPVVSAIAQVASGNNDLYNVQIVGQPTNTQCTFQINRVSAGLILTLLSALSINPTNVAAILHCIAIEP